MSRRLEQELRDLRGSTSQKDQATRLGLDPNTYQRLEDPARHHRRAKLDELDKAMVRQKVPGWKIGDAVTYDSEDSLVVLRLEMTERLDTINAKLDQVVELLERRFGNEDLATRLRELLEPRAG